MSKRKNITLDPKWKIIRGTLLIAFVVIALGNLFKVIKEFYDIKYASLDNQDKSQLFNHIGDQEYNLNIPSNISKNKDCRKFFEWQNDNIHPTLLRKKCPWVRYPKQKKISIGKQKFSIDRDYLDNITSVMLDDRMDLFVIAFTYPDLKPSGGVNVEEIRASVSSIKSAREAADTNKREYLQNVYWKSYLLVNFDDQKYEIKKIAFDPDIRRMHYKFTEIINSKGLDIRAKKILEERLNWTSERIRKYAQRKQNAPVRYFQNDIYTNSDPYFPDEFIVCDNNSKTLRQICKSGFFVEDLFVNITFSKMQLANFDDIKTKFLSMILNWKVNK